MNEGIIFISSSWGIESTKVQKIQQQAGKAWHQGKKKKGGQIILDLYKVKRLTANSYMLNKVKADPTDTPPIPKDQKSRENFSDT